jgi:predicted dienelactone hydrolase
MEANLLKRTLAIVILALMAASIGFLSFDNEASAANAIENYYKAQGSWAVSTGTATDSHGYTYHLWYPTNLGSGGYLHPIISFGVGTSATPSQYADTLDQLASWGFVVIANDNGTQGLGQYIVAGAQYMVAKNSDSGSIFYNKLDTSKIGAFGHSQGAGGVLNAVLAQPTLFKAAIPNALPNPMWWSTPVPSLTGWPTAVPIWIQCGTSDGLICSLSAMQTWYNQVPGAAARARAKSAGHNELQAANNKYQGYDTAWFLYTLKGDTYARGAFAGASPELPTNTTRWQDWAAKNLP